jgi:ATP-binding cassette subfamily C protein CydD
MHKELFQQVRHTWNALLLTVILGMVGAAMTIVQMTILSRIVDRVFLAHQDLGRVELLLLLLLGVIAAHAGLVWAREVSGRLAAIHAKSELRGRLFAHLLQLGPAYSRGERTGELVATAVEGVERLDAYVSRYLPQMFLSVLVPLLIAAYILTVDWISALLLLVTAPIIPLLMILVGSHAEEHMKRQWLALSRMSAHFLDAVQGLPTLKLFGGSKAEHERIARISERFRERTLKVLRLAFLSGMILEFMTAVAIGVVAVMLGIRLLDGGISFEHAFLVLLLAPEFYRPLHELGVHRHAGMEGRAAATRIVEILQTPIPFNTRAESSWRPASPLTITFQDVTFTYPGGDRPALSAINLTLPAGARTALVGRSGAGKSTLVNLLMRFIDTDSGRIIVNGFPLADLPIEIWRKYVALVPQRPYLFNGSVRENILLARPTASEQEIVQAAELAGAATFIEQLPQGYDSTIGEQGARLSAGQAQRLAIARAFLKDAPLLILDEPTSSLDPESEAHIREALALLMRDRTVLVIAHRLNTITSAEQIAVLDSGSLVEVGQHTDLLQRNGLYASLIAAYQQAMGHR